MRRILFFALTLASSLFAQVTSENNDQLREGLKRFPEADTNKDGILTLEEGRAFLQKMKKKPAEAAKPKANALKPDFADIAYGPHERNKIDLYLAKSEQPTPVVFMIHGGGFRNGDKSRWASDKQTDQLLASGVSCVAVNYPFLDSMPIQDILRQCARAVQFVRSKAGEWKLDKTRFASMGGSAGAGTSLWLATHDDMADPKAEDPVLRESTRLTCAVCNATQATYDLTRWESFLGPVKPEFNTSEAEGALFYHLPSVADLATDRGKSVLKECDMLAWISADDPPLFLSNPQVVSAPTNRGEWLHCIQHAREVQKECTADHVLCIVAQDAPEPKPDAVQFLLQHLKVSH
ncbi:alpha/beta hydrolase fold domain-containing protein [Prosthecobacter sp.]|uniref:alpha/beta hydrolase fold domain-containing protein n=1 Tax=Prosthecobacter sp. TaxID=1965333 RepID=UPI001D1BE8C6|nr:alpha/beta hydrolase fold domain-containing protein [Prosthecobacter sp.]MCB1275890.1 alpha/beta hydrolase fold domain-containing protein [Prosthecobacter sp.]